MIKRTTIIVLLLVIAQQVNAQNSNSSTTTPRPRSTNVNSSPPVPTRSVPKPAASKAAPPAERAPSPEKPTSAPVPGSTAVMAAFNRLIDGIQTADVEKVMSVYWKSPSLTLYNYNGTVTKGWEQVRQNRLSSYPAIKDAKLDVRDVSITMLGRDGAVINCLWTQTQTYKGAPETASGRMTLVFKRFGTAWKAINLHTSPDVPNPSSVPPSEQASPKPSPTP